MRVCTFDVVNIRQRQEFVKFAAGTAATFKNTVQPTLGVVGAGSARAMYIHSYR